MCYTHATKALGGGDVKMPDDLRHNFDVAIPTPPENKAIDSSPFFNRRYQTCLQEMAQAPNGCALALLEWLPRLDFKGSLPTTLEAYKNSGPVYAFLDSAPVPNFYKMAFVEASAHRNGVFDALTQSAFRTLTQSAFRSYGMFVFDRMHTWEGAYAGLLSHLINSQNATARRAYSLDYQVGPCTTQ